MHLIPYDLITIRMNYFTMTEITEINNNFRLHWLATMLL